SVDDQVRALSAAFDVFTGAPLSAAVIDRLRGATAPQLGLALRIRGGKIVRVGGLAPGIGIAEIERLCSEASIPVDPTRSTLVGALGERVERVEYVRAGEHAGVDIYLEPAEPGPKAAAPAATDTN